MFCDNGILIYYDILIGDGIGIKGVNCAYLNNSKVLLNSFIEEYTF
jgi:hypothetical protein